MIIITIIIIFLALTRYSNIAWSVSQKQIEPAAHDSFSFHSVLRFNKNQPKTPHALLHIYPILLWRAWW